MLLALYALLLSSVQSVSQSVFMHEYIVTCQHITLIGIFWGLVQDPPLEVSTLYLIACLRARHANRVVVIGGVGGGATRERADHRLSAQAATISTDEHLCFRTFLFNRMRVVDGAL